MSYWVLRIGLSLIAAGLVLLSPIADLLPVDFWPSLKGLFLPESPSSIQHIYFRVVLGEPSHFFEYALVASGILLTASAWYLGSKE
jgi:hypothetical protein